MFNFLKRLFQRKPVPVAKPPEPLYIQQFGRGLRKEDLAPAPRWAPVPVAEQSPEKRAEDREVMLRLVRTPYRPISVPGAPAPLAAPTAGSTAPRSAPVPASRAYTDSDDYFNPANPLSPLSPLNHTIYSPEPAPAYSAPAPDYSCPAPSPSYDPPPCSPSPSFDFGSPSPDSSSW